MDTDSFTVYIKTEDVAKDVETLERSLWFDTSDYEIDHYLKKKIKKIIVVMKANLGGKIINRVCCIDSKYVC